MLYFIVFWLILFVIEYKMTKFINNKDKIRGLGITVANSFAIIGYSFTRGYLYVKNKSTVFVGFASATKKAISILGISYSRFRAITIFGISISDFNADTFLGISIVRFKGYYSYDVKEAFTWIGFAYSADTASVMLGIAIAGKDATNSMIGISPMGLTLIGYTINLNTFKKLF